jgi:WD repeat-containing protein 68
MPFPSHHHPSSSSNNHNAPSPTGAASGIYQAAQTLGSIGAPTGNLRAATSGSTTSGTDASSGRVPGLTSSGYPAPPSIAGLPRPQRAETSTVPISTATTTALPFQSPRRAQTFSKQPDELHMPTSPQKLSGSPPNLPLAEGQAQDSQGMMEASPGGQQSSSNPQINRPQGSSQGQQYTSASSTGGHPGSLQPGRPGPLGSNPAIAHISTQPANPPSRSATISHTHAYSRSSPVAGFEGQGHVPFTSTPEHSKYVSPPNQKYTPASMGIGASNSPLGLADIRPRADSGMSDSPAGSNPYSYDGHSTAPTNSNYLAPWAMYAFDWCKWPVQQAGAGKIAIGSYLEDGHNFVRNWLPVLLNTLMLPDSNPRHQRCLRTFSSWCTSV